ncbi:MAG: hypothetical protein AB2766_11380 [Candidatus Thiodiazotropha endolucinida]
MIDDPLIPGAVFGPADILAVFLWIRLVPDGMPGVCQGSPLHTDQG